MTDVRGVLPGQRPPVDPAVLDEPTSEVPVIRPSEPDPEPDPQPAAESAPEPDYREPETILAYPPPAPPTRDEPEAPGDAAEPEPEPEAGAELEAAVVPAQAAAGADLEETIDVATDVEPEADSVVELPGAVTGAPAWPPVPAEPAVDVTAPVAESTVEIEEPEEPEVEVEEPAMEVVEQAAPVEEPAEAESVVESVVESVAATEEEPTVSEPPHRAPGEVDHTPIALWSDEAADRLRTQWRDLQVQFIDDPDVAVAGAKSLVTEAVQELADTLLAAQEDLDPYRDAERADTEAMRVAMRRYREFLDRVLAL